MEPARNFFAFFLLAGLGCLAWAGTGWAFSRSLLDPSDQTDPAWLLAEVSAPATAPAASAESILEKKSQRSPGTAVSLALVPGIVLHGSGQFYAGRPWAGGALLLAEAGGLFMAYRGGRDVYSAVNSVDFDKFSNYHGDTGQISNGLGLALGGVMIFLSSWLYDLTGSPIEVEQARAGAKLAGPGASSSPVVTPRLTARGVEVAVERLF